jgi:hypothetical protein
MAISTKQINAVSSLPSLSHDNESAISDLNTLSVRSVQSVHNNYNEEIVLLLKESFDRYNLNQLLEVYKDLTGIKDYMETTIESNVRMPEHMDTMRYIDNYCHARGWQ